MKNIDINDFGVYLWTSNQQLHCVQAYAYLFNKFWPFEQEVTVLGYKQPEFQLPDNFNFTSLGEQRGPKFWSNDMKDYFATSKHKAFYMVPEDALLIKEVDKELLSLAIKIALLKEDEKFLRFGLTADIQGRSHEIIKEYDDFDLIRASQSEIYRFSLQQSIWSTKNFLSSLELNQSPWDFELNNSKSRNNGLDVYATKRKYCIHSTNVYKKGRKRPDWSDCVNKRYTKFEGLNQNDVNYIEKQSWVKELIK